MAVSVAGKENGGPRFDMKAKRLIGQLERVELEDKYIELYDENMLLKKHAKSQEEKMKKLATKLLKLSSDEKRVRDVSASSDLEEKVIEMTEKLMTLEKQNANLKGKMSVMKQQLDTRGIKQAPYHHVTPKINSGLKTDRLSSTERRSPKGMQISPSPVRYGRSLLEEARKENEELEELVISLKEEIRLLREEVDYCKEENKVDKLTNQGIVLQLQEQIQLYKSDVQRMKIEEDVDKIRLHRELQEKKKLLETTESRCITLESNVEVIKGSSDQLMKEIEQLNGQLKEEQRRSRELQNQIQTLSVQQRSINELQDMLSDVKFEKDLLKQRNDRLMKSLLSSSVPVAMGTDDGRVKVLEDKLNEMEENLLKGKRQNTDITEQLNNERNLTKRLNDELSEVKGQYSSIQHENHQLKLSLENESKPKGQELAPPIIPAPVVFPSVIESGREVEELRAAYNETNNELLKTKKLLTLQTKLSDDYKREIEILQEKVREEKSHFEERENETNRLLSIKAERIKKLEGQVKDLAYKPQRTTTRQQTTTEQQQQQQQQPSVIPVTSTKVFDVPVNSTSSLNLEEEEEEREGEGEGEEIREQILEEKKLLIDGVGGSKGDIVATPSPPSSSNNGTTLQAGMTDGVNGGIIADGDRHIDDDELTVVSEDTMFGDSLHSDDNEELILSPLTAKSPTPSPTKPSVILRQSSEADDDIGDSLDLSDNTIEDDDDDNDETLSHIVRDDRGLMDEDIVRQVDDSIEVKFSVTIVSFTIEDDSPLIDDESVEQLFIEYQMLDFDSSELETPSSLPKPLPGQPAFFNFEKEFNVSPQTNTMKLLKQMISSDSETGNNLIPFTLVSDPPGDGNDIVCEEIGSCHVNLYDVLKDSTDDSHIIDEDVCDIDDQHEIIGFLTIKLTGLNSLRQLSQIINVKKD